MERTKTFHDDEDAENPLPSVIDGHARADRVIQESDRNQGDRSPFVLDELDPLVIPKPKEEGIVVTVNPGDRELVITFKEQIVAVVWWRPNVGRFRVKRRIAIDSEGRKQQMVEHWETFPATWRLCCDYGVTTAEFQAAFRDLPPQVKWTFDQCPWERTDCQLRLEDPKSRALPNLLCKRCGARFKQAEDGECTLIDRGVNPFTPREVAVAPAAPAKPAVPFDVDFCRYQGLGKAKLDQLSKHSIASWQQLASLSPEFLKRLGWSQRTIDMALEIAKEKAG